MNEDLKYDQAGLDLTEAAEGLRLTAYPDPGTGGAPWTIGYGHTGPEVHPGMTITQEEAEAYLVSDLHYAEVMVKHLVEVPLTQGQYDALVDFTFNCGVGNLQQSTLLKLVNLGDMTRAVEEFKKWNKGGGRVLAGLTARRDKEAALFVQA